MMTPKEKTEQIENGKNWIVEFWRVRGYEVVKTALGISFTLHRKEPKYESLGLDLTYLEQFRDEVLRLFCKNIEKVKVTNDGVVSLGDLSEYKIIKKQEGI